MSTLTTIQGTDLPTNSRANINDNFSALNTDKMETSVLDTDTTLAANSDSKVATQKAVKAYVDAGGNVNASTTTKGIVELGTIEELKAGTATGSTGASLMITPDILQPKLGIKTVTAGATIAGATLPVPVYQNKTDNEFYACDANDTGAMKFIGFAISNGTDGNSFQVQFTGIVSGFSGLDEGEKYYVQDTAGTIGTTIGTYEILVGIAISPTELLIQKGKRRASGATDISAVTASGSEVITCGFRPSRIRLFGLTAEISTAAGNIMDATWDNGVLTAASIWPNAAGGTSITTARLYDGNTTSYLTFTITSVTDTGFTITYTETGTWAWSEAVYKWEAEGEI